jgi:hypothetical protein
MIKLRGFLIDPNAAADHVHVAPAHRRSLWHHLQTLIERNRHPRVQVQAPDASENSHL